MFDTGMFLKLKFKEDAQSVNNHIDSFALNIAKKAEMVRKRELVTLGLDIGIDEDKDLFLFEANSAPDTSLLQEEVAKLRTDYYAYLLEKKCRTGSERNSLKSLFSSFLQLVMLGIRFYILIVLDS